MAAPNIYQIAGKCLSMYEGLYKEVDPQYKGIIKAPAAAAFLKRSNLPNAVLGQIWELADKDAKGYLDKESFFVALKLVTCVQHGQDLNSINLTLDLPAPIIASQAESPSLPAFGSFADSAVQEWAIKVKDQTKYEEIFHSLGPVNGKLSGEQVKPVLLNSGLPSEVLGTIWELSDIDKDGFFDRDEMCIALHLVYRALENEPVPAVLPQNMIPPAKRRPSFAGSQHSMSRKSSGVVAGGVRVLPPQASLSRRSRTSSVTSMDSVGMMGGSQQSPGTAARSLTGTPVPTPPIVKPPAPWIVDKYKWEQVFNDADSNKDGLVSGTDVKHIFLQTGLAQAYLAHIWNLCDMNSSGFLNFEQFALAMHFVEQKKQRNVEPPASLPPDLVPPSFRPNPAGMTDIATSTNQESMAAPLDVSDPKQHSGNKEIDLVLDEIRLIQQEKLEYERQVVQLEADITIKNAEIRNLEVELNTLQATVKQLERQKGEAHRRLDDLDNQRTSLNESLNEMILKNDEDYKIIESLKQEIEAASSAATARDASVNEKRQQMQSLVDEEMDLESKLQSGRKKLHNLNKEQRDSENYASRAEEVVQQLRSQREGLLEKLQKLEQIVKDGDVNSMLESDAGLLSMDDEYNLNKIMGFEFMTSSASMNAVIGLNPEEKHQAAAAAAFDDPFKSYDPFSGGVHDPFADQDPFASTVPVEDPFASSDPFASHSAPTFPPTANVYGVGQFGTGGESAMLAALGGGGKKAPPRPAPPAASKSSSSLPPPPSEPGGNGGADMSSSPVVDPFSGGGGQPSANDGGSSSTAFGGCGGSAAGFANFADFAKFA